MASSLPLAAALADQTSPFNYPFGTIRAPRAACQLYLIVLHSLVPSGFLLSTKPGVHCALVRVAGISDENFRLAPEDRSTMRSTTARERSTTSVQLNPQKRCPGSWFEDHGTSTSSLSPNFCLTVHQGFDIGVL